MFSGLCQGPFSGRTYPVLARVALTPTHTATKTAGRPADTEGQREGLTAGFCPHCPGLTPVHGGLEAEPRPTDAA